MNEVSTLRHRIFIFWAGLWAISFNFLGGVNGADAFAPKTTFAWSPQIRLETRRSIPSEYFSYSLRERNTNDDGGEKNARPGISSSTSNRKSGGQQLLIRFVNDIWYVMSSPFPDLRKLIRKRSTNINNNVGTGDSPKTMALSLRLRDGVAAVLAYLTLGAFTYRFVFEKWSLIDSLYFTTVIFSTVGYGDLCPTTVTGKLFSCIFGVAGIALLGAAVATIGSRLLEAENATLQIAQKQSQKRILQIYDKMPKVVQSLRPNVGNTTVTESKAEATATTKSTNSPLKESDCQEVLRDAKYEFLDTILQPAKPSMLAAAWKAARYTVQSLLVVGLGGLFIGHLEGWAWYDSLYYSLITASTIGLGDFAPVTRTGRLAAVIFIPLSVAAAGEILASVGMAIVARRQKKLFDSQLNSGLTMDTIKEMDDNGDGKVAREEYVAYMLMEMGLVTRDELEELWDQFERLDATKSGYLDQEDLVLMAKLRRADLEKSSC